MTANGNASTEPRCTFYPKGILPLQPRVCQIRTNKKNIYIESIDEAECQRCDPDMMNKGNNQVMSYVLSVMQQLGVKDISELQKKGTFILTTTNGMSNLSLVKTDKTEKVLLTNMKEGDGKQVLAMIEEEANRTLRNSTQPKQGTTQIRKVENYGGKVVHSSTAAFTKTKRTYTGRDNIKRVVYEKNGSSYVKRKDMQTGKFVYRKVKV